MVLRFIFLLIFSIAGFALTGQTKVPDVVRILDDELPGYELSDSNLLHLEDQSGKLTLEEVRQQLLNGHMKQGIREKQTQKLHHRIYWFYNY
jgi:hypothetical protein